MPRNQPCPDHGGTGAKSKCPECHRESNRRYYEKNRDKVAESNRRYYEKNRDKMLEYHRRYRQENRDEILEKKRRYYEKNRDKIAERNRRYHQKNREKLVEYGRRYYQENREYLIAQANKCETTKNLASQYFATNSGKPWTPQEVAKMHRLRLQGLTNYEVAVELGRSLNSVNGKIARENARN